jgi:drug/metabolite transporter (DMT)-like permease
VADHWSRATNESGARAARTAGGRALHFPRPAPRLAAVLVLSFATAIWGASFVLAKGLVDNYDPMSVLVLRFAIGTVALWALRPGAVRALPTADRWHAAVIGLLLGTAQVPHYFGVRESSASAAAFLIGTYVVATPVFDRVLYGVRTIRTAAAGAVLALCGLAVIAAGGTLSLLGLSLCLAAAILYAVQISAVGAWVPPTNIWGFTTVTVAVITVVLAVPAGVRGLEIPTSCPDWLRLLYLALIAGVAGVAMQAWSQRRIAATQAAVTLVMEPVWAAGFAVLFTTETLTRQLVVGGAVLLVANLVVALGSRRGVHAPEGSHNWS